MDECVVSVAVPLPFQTPFSYRLPKGTPRPEPGAVSYTHLTLPTN